MSGREFAHGADGFLAVCDAPDHCRTPPGDVPVPYQVTARLGRAVALSPDVRYGGVPVVLADASAVPQVTGNEAGTGGGVVSGVNRGRVAFVAGAATVRANGRRIVRHLDPVTMNDRNTTGKVLALAGAAPAGGVGPDGRPLVPCDPLGAKPRAFTHPGALSRAGIHWLKGLEGAVKEGGRHVLYNDSRGFATIGYGHLVARKPYQELTEAERAPCRDGWSEDQAAGQFRQDLRRVEDGIHQNLHADLSPSQFDALVSLGFNAGRAALLGSPVARAIAAGDYAQAGAAIQGFRAGAGNAVRRRCESRLFREGIYESR